MPFKRGAPKGNQNRFVHGLYGKELMARKAAIRKRMQIVRMVVRRVTILCRLREALARKNVRLQGPEATPPAYGSGAARESQRRGEAQRRRPARSRAWRGGRRYSPSGEVAAHSPSIVMACKNRPSRSYLLRYSG
jgi:hypothetical protein